MKLKGLTIIQIILGIISIIGISILLTSVSNFIYYIFINNFNIEEYFFNNTVKSITLNEVKEAYNLLIDYVILGSEFKGLGVLKYNDLGLSHLEDVRNLYFNIKLVTVFSIGIFSILCVLFKKDSIFSYSKFNNKTPYFYIGLIPLIFVSIILLIGIMDFNTLFDLFHKVVFKLNFAMNTTENEYINILPSQYFMIMFIVIGVLVILFSSLFIVLDYLIIRKEIKGMSKVKLIAIDLDGTLLNDKKEIMPRTYRALRKASNEGVYVVLASGRPIKGMMHLIKELKLDEKENYVINFNGASVNKTQSLESIYNCSLTIDEMKEIEEFAIKHNVHSHAFINGDLYLEENAKYSDVEASINHITPIICKYSDFNEEDVVNKYMFADEPSKLEEIYPLIPKELFEKYTVVFSAKFFLEFLNKETNKGKALKALCEYLKIDPSEVMAIGDEENDLSMLEYAGHKIAMDNANKKLKDIATYITSSNNDEGVGKAVEKLVLNKL